VTDGVRAAVVVASNRAAAGVYEDTTGPLIVAGLRDAGFEVGIHTWDHVKWQDGVATADAAWTTWQMSLARERFREVFGEAPAVHGAAGWQMNVHAWRATQSLGFAYASDTRGTHPYVPVIRAETRRLTAWFDQKFQREVTIYILYEKVNKRLTNRADPSGDTIRAGQANLRVHMNYIAWLVERRRWLAGEEFGLADITAAAQLSCLDYLGSVPWDDYPAVKEWYAPVKSRPSFRPLLLDRVAGLTPPAHYPDLDF